MRRQPGRRRGFSGQLDLDARAAKVDPDDLELVDALGLVGEDHRELALGCLTVGVPLDDPLQLAVVEALQEHGRESNAWAGTCLASG
jgi:hypothetical protein